VRLWGYVNCDARGGILRPVLVRLRQKRSANSSLSIKNESMEIEDDQIPS